MRSRGLGSQEKPGILAKALLSPFPRGPREPPARHRVSNSYAQTLAETAQGASRRPFLALGPERIVNLLSKALLLDVTVTSQLSHGAALRVHKAGGNLTCQHLEDEPPVRCLEGY